MTPEDTEHAIDRHEEAIMQDAKAINELRETQKLIIHALAQLPQFLQQHTAVGEREKVGQAKHRFETLLAQLQRRAEDGQS
jgi:hypothetical protein